VLVFCFCWGYDAGYERDYFIEYMVKSNNDKYKNHSREELIGVSAVRKELIALEKEIEIAAK
jgi:hypothetical protein